MTIDLKCSECGKDLEVYRVDSGYIHVIPCATCVDEARSEGYEVGYSDGYDHDER